MLSLHGSNRRFRTLFFLALVAFAATLWLHGNAHAGGPAVIGKVHGRAVYNTNVLKKLPGFESHVVTLKPTSLPANAPAPLQQAFAAQQANAPAAGAVGAANTTGSGYNYVYYQYPYYPYQTSVIGSITQYAYLYYMTWYGTPYCVYAYSNTLLTPYYVGGNAQQRLYVSYYGGFSLESYLVNLFNNTLSGYGSTKQVSGCYQLLHGDTWYNSQQGTCSYPYNCSDYALGEFDYP